MFFFPSIIVDLNDFYDSVDFLLMIMIFMILLISFSIINAIIKII